MQKILIIGATSAIAESTAQRFAARGASLYLLARNQERLAALATDLTIRGAALVRTAAFDADGFAGHEALLWQAVEALQGIDVALIAHGSLSDQPACEKSFPRTLQELNINAISVISLLTHLANMFEVQRHGTIAVITSVAGDRASRSHYVYAAAKSAVSIFLQGLRGRLRSRGVQVLTIKPGPVDTPMTASFRKGFLWAKPQSIAAGIDRAIHKKRSGEIYLPRYWAAVMLILRLLPERLFYSVGL